MPNSDRSRVLEQDLTRLSARPGGPLLLKVPDAAALLSLGKSTLYVLISQGEIPVVRIRGSVRIRADDLIRWVEQQPRDGGPPVER